MIPVGDSQRRIRLPLVTWTLIALNIFLYLWSRRFHPFGPLVTFADLMMIPHDVVDAIPRAFSDGFALTTTFTSLFLHGNLLHLVGNMLFLLVFGSTLEEALGGWRYAFYYLAWGIAASAAHVFVHPLSETPTLGASGAIGGVLGAYFLLFPSNKVHLIIPFLPWLEWEATAWVLLGIWFLWQILIPQQDVANWAHAGGFLAGMLTVLVMGGRQRVLKQAQLAGELP
jgi:membrane associated rhomboid family serine protease